jgi:hypothetical protein
MADRNVFLVDGRAVAGTPEDQLASENPRIVEFLEAEGARPAPSAGADA